MKLLNEGIIYEIIAFILLLLLIIIIIRIFAKIIHGDFCKPKNSEIIRESIETFIPFSQEVSSTSNNTNITDKDNIPIVTVL
jgi:hypothetical protein